LLLKHQLLVLNQGHKRAPVAALGSFIQPSIHRQIETQMNLIPITNEIFVSKLVKSSELLISVCESTVAMYSSGAPIMPWIGYLAEERGTIVGTCAFKTPPDSDGVEIAYFTFPGYEGQGVATRMASRLVEIAVQQGVLRLRAQTLPQPSASTRILEKLGFTFVGTVVHGQDGNVWTWELVG
jgi:[ribosomal protein S5]-alanine N-acetyltransferase